MKNLCLSITIGLSALIFSSCAAHIVAERPAPPPFVRPVAPGHGYVWIDGDWYINGGRYTWREGYWAPARKKHWVSGHWASRRNGWYWQRGHWR